ncbi:hypothetical protein HPB47_002379, partial [Ixodes persulcatus]
LQSSVVWLNARQIAGFYHWLDPIPQLMVQKNLTGYGQVMEDDGATKNCVVLNVSTGKLSTGDCSTKQDFVCIEDTQLKPLFHSSEHVSVALRTNRPPILQSSQLPDLTLTCRAAFRNGSAFMEAIRGSYAYAYVWTKNDVYLNESFRSIQPEKVIERTTFSHSYASSQGHYRCGLKALPSGSTVWSNTVTVVLEAGRRPGVTGKTAAIRGPDGAPLRSASGPRAGVHVLFAILSRKSVLRILEAQDGLGRKLQRSVAAGTVSCPRVTQPGQRAAGRASLERPRPSAGRTERLCDPHRDREPGYADPRSRAYSSHGIYQTTARSVDCQSIACGLRKSRNRKRKGQEGAAEQMDRQKAHHRQVHVLFAILSRKSVLRILEAQDGLGRKLQRSVAAGTVSCPRVTQPGQAWPEALRKKGGKGELEISGTHVSELQGTPSHREALSSGAAARAPVKRERMSLVRRGQTGSLDPEEERTIVNRISTLLANPDSFLRRMVVPGTAEVYKYRILALMLRETRLNVNDQLVYIYLEDMRPVVRRCEGNFTVGASWGPVQGVCMMRPSQRTLDLKALSMEEVSSESMGATADRLQQLTTEKRSLDPLDIVYVAKTVENIASTGVVSRQVAQDVVTALDNVLNAEESTLQLSRSANSTNRLLGAMEEVSRRLDSDTVVFQRSVALGRISKFQPSTLGVAIHLDLEQRYNFVDARNLTQGTDVAFVFSKSNQFQLDRELSIGVMGSSSLFEDSFQPADDESSELVFEICSSVLLAKYENEEVDNVREPFSIYFKQS